jgi:hypothetical protein
MPTALPRFGGAFFGGAAAGGQCRERSPDILRTPHRRLRAAAAAFMAHEPV